MRVCIGGRYYSNAANLTCQQCGNTYWTRLHKGEPRAKRFCGRKCLWQFMSRRPIRKWSQQERDYVRSPWEIIEDDALEKYREAPPMPEMESRALEKRFINAYLSGVDDEGLIERFGTHYGRMRRMLTRAQVTSRPKRVDSENMGKAPKDTKIQWKHFNFQRKFFQSIKSEYVPITDGLLGEDAHV